jgi:DNA-directed RNA polymerase specialized sigma24 family protein
LSADFEEFVAQRLPALLRFGTVLCGDPGTAEDVVQEVLIRAHLKWRRISRDDDLLRVARGLRGVETAPDDPSGWPADPLR